MPEINRAFKEITCKIVYYGPGAGGKTTNLAYVHGNVPQKHRGELVSLATEQDRTLFFDFLPLDIGDVRGYKTKFKMYTVPGQVFYNQTRKLVLRGVDGVVFVADSQENRYQDNIDSLNNLRENLRDYGLELEDLPFVLQYNKRDTPDAMPLEKLRESLNPTGKYVEFEAVAVDGTGVRESLRDITAQCLAVLKERQNIVLDEEEASERLGVGAGALQSPPQRAGGQSLPMIDVAQDSRWSWRGIGIGSGTVTIESRRSDSGDIEYSLKASYKVLFSSRSMIRTVRFVNEEKRETESGERTFYLLKDRPKDKKPVSVLVEKTDSEPHVFMIYDGIGGEIRVGPSGVKNPF
jgi:signal recognition particle receptor subunit beta